MTAVYIILSLIGLLVTLGSYFYIRHFLPIRPKEDGFEYVHVNEDGTVRELDREEQEYLNIEFDGADGARPYIKTRYNQLTPDNKMWGYIPRRRVPRKITIESISGENGHSNSGLTPEK